MRPEFGCGVHDYVFESIDAYTLGRLEHEIREALDRWEPRIACSTSTSISRDATEGVLLIDITYALLRDERPAEPRLPLLRHPGRGAA